MNSVFGPILFFLPGFFFAQSSLAALSCAEFLDVKSGVKIEKFIDIEGDWVSFSKVDSRLEHFGVLISLGVNQSSYISPTRFLSELINIHGHSFSTANRILQGLIADRLVSSKAVTETTDGRKRQLEVTALGQQQLKYFLAVKGISLIGLFKYTKVKADLKKSGLKVDLDQILFAKSAIELLPSTTQSEFVGILIGQFGLSAATASRLYGKLISEELIKAVVSESDRRVRYIVMTKKASEILSQSNELLN